jgi:hypothetical protein
MIDGFPLSFFLPLIVHTLAALTTGATGAITFSRPKRSVRHPKWGCGPTLLCFSRPSSSRSATYQRMRTSSFWQRSAMASHLEAMEHDAFAESSGCGAC